MHVAGAYILGKINANICKMQIKIMKWVERGEEGGC